MYAVYYKSLLTGDIVRVPGTFSLKTADLVIRVLADKMLNRLYWLEPVAYREINYNSYNVSRIPA